MPWNKDEPTLILLACALLLIFYTVFNDAFAAVADMGKITVVPASDSMKGKAVGVTLSKTCIALAKNNQSGNYPNYADLIEYDTSLQKYSGKFITTNGYVHRESVKHGFGMYRYDNTFRVFIDPPLTWKIPIIEIQCNALKEFHLPSQMTVKLNNTSQQFDRYYSQYRYVNSSCDYAYITGNNWKTILPDTIDYLKSDCKTTNLTTLVKHSKPASQHDIGTSSKQKLEKYYNLVKTQCSKTYGKCKIVNSAVTLDEDTK